MEDLNSTSVLEVTLLRIPSSLSPQSQYPTILPALRKVRTSLASHVHPTHSRFYTSDEDPSYIYILGSWPTLEAHTSFLTNDKLRDEILGPQEGLLEFVWGMHVIINGENAMSTRILPLDAPVLVFERFFLKKDVWHLAGYERLLKEMNGIIEGRTEGFSVFENARLDTGEDQHEILRFSGWESRKSHEVWVQGMREDKVVRAVRDSCEGAEAVHLCDIESMLMEGV